MQTTNVVFVVCGSDVRGHVVARRNADARVARPRIRRRRALRLARRRLAALAAGGLLLGGRPALRRAAARVRRMRFLPAAARGARRVRDSRGPLLRHTLVLQRLVLLLVLDVGSFVRHRVPPRRIVMDKFHRGGFENASPVCGDRTVLRPVTEDDVDLLLRWHADPDVLRFWDGETFTRGSMLVRLAREDVMPYLVLADGEPVGYLQVWGEGDGGIDMFLAPDVRGRGLGPDAGRAMARHLRDDHGWTRVTVDPYEWNDIAVRAWRNAGFVEVSRHEPDDEHTATWVLMEFRGA